MAKQICAYCTAERTIEEDGARSPCAACSHDPLVAGEYILESLIGRGMATTYRARSVTNDARVVVKRIELGEIEDWKVYDLFEREAAVLRRLDHPCIPEFVASGSIEDRGVFFLVQTWIDAQNLDEVMSRRALDDDEITVIGLRLLDILEYLHTLSPAVIHRDIKPGNILYDHADRLYLVDFGTVRATLSKTATGVMTGGGASSTTVVGTLGYMAPEQFFGQASPASDLFGVGATLLRLATGKHPADLPHDGVEIDLSGIVESLRPRIRRIVVGLMKSRPSERPQSVADARALFDSPKSDRDAAESSPAPSSELVTRRGALSQRPPSYSGAAFDIASAAGNVANALEKVVSAFVDPKWRKRQTGHAQPPPSAPATPAPEPAQSLPASRAEPAPAVASRPPRGRKSRLQKRADAARAHALARPRRGRGALRRVGQAVRFVAIASLILLWLLIFVL